MSIITEELQDVVVVPTTAIHYSGNDTTVTLDSGGKKVTRPVTIGAASGGNTQVTSGLVGRGQDLRDRGHLPRRRWAPVPAPVSSADGGGRVRRAEVAGFGGAGGGFGGRRRRFGG